MNLDGRAALITGGGRGIGAATAEALACAGARVGVAARTIAEVEEVAARIRAEGREAFAFRCDVTDADDVTAAARAAEQAMGPIGILVNNAGAASSDPFRRTTLEEWNRLLAVNATGTFLCTQAVLGGMLDGGWGRIVNVASVAGLEGAPYVSAYTASKHAVVGLTRALAEEVVGTGVSVNAVCPGWVDTPMTRRAVQGVAEKTGAAEGEALEAILAQSGQSRLLATDEVAARILEVCVADAATNGKTLVINN